LTYSCTDFTDDILNALEVDVPEEDYDNPSKQADLALAEIERLQDLARNAAGLDLYAVAHMSPDALRQTLLEYREQAQRILNNSDSTP
jgi:hypothetical protein